MKMDEFPRFMKDKKNEIDEGTDRQIEGYMYDGANGSQMIHWTCNAAGKSAEHVHDYDEYFIVVQGRYDLIIKGKTIPVKAGDEYYIPKRVAHAGEFIAGTRTIHCFGGKRAKRATLVPCPIKKR
jgi:mannose-6-phosphate isomerase-like protein (cupin superfamily)